MRMGVARGVGTARGATGAMPQGTWPHVRPLPPCSSRSRRTPRPAVSAMMQGLCLGWRAQGVAMAAHGTNTGVADARVPDSRHARSGTRAHVPSRARAPPLCRGQCAWQGGADARRGGTWRRHSTRRCHAQCCPSSGTGVRCAARGHGTPRPRGAAIPPPRGDDQHGCASLPERRRRPRRCHASRIATGWYLACVPRRHGEASRARSRTKFMHTGPARARAGTGCRLAAYFARNPNGIREYRASWAPVV